MRTKRNRNKKQTRKRKQKIKGGNSAALFKAIKAGNIGKVNKIVCPEEGEKNFRGQKYRRSNTFNLCVFTK